MGKEPKMMSVIEIPLKTEKWQEDVLFKRFELYRKVYNAMLGHEIKQYRKMLADDRYKASKAVIDDVYRIADAKEKAAAKKTEEYKQASEVQRELFREYGMSEFGFSNTATDYYRIYSQNIPAATVAPSISKPMWAAFNKCLFGNGKKVSFKKFDTWSSVASAGKSGLRLVNGDGKNVLHRSGNENLWCVFGTNKGKILKMPLKIDNKDLWLIEMLDRDIKIVRLVRKKVRGKYRYAVQLTVTGAPAIRYDRNTGEIKNQIGTGKVGVYIDTTSVTICTKDGLFSKDLSDAIPDFQDKIAEQQRIMDEASRRTNPDNYNEDGTIKNGVMVDGKRRRLTWIRTRAYKEARDKKANLQRIESEQRSIKRHILANEILSYGDHIVVNDYPFQWAAMRKQYEEGDEVTESGRPKKKRKKGSEIGHNAPAILVTLMDAKLKAAGYQGVEKVKLKDMDYSAGYRQYYATKLYEGRIESDEET